MKLPRRQFLRPAASTAALPVFSRIARAQAYPSRPVAQVVPDDWESGIGVTPPGSIRVDIVMSQMERFSALIGDIYDASLDPALWPAVFEQVCYFVRGCSATLYSQDTIRKTAKFHFAWGDNPDFTQLYRDQYAKLNPLFPAVQFLEVETVHAVADIVPCEEFRESRFYTEWVRPQGFVDGVFSNLEKTTTSCTAFTVMRHERDGVADDDTRRRMGLIVPHVRRAVLIGKVIDHYKVEAAALADTLDGLAAAMFLVDANGRVVHANARGRRMLAEGDLLRAPYDKLIAADARSDRALHEVFTAAGDGDAAVGVKGIAVPLLAREGERWIAHVLPLTSGARRRAGVAYAAAAAVFVRRAALDILSPIECMGNVYRLTPSELRVLNALVEVNGVPAVSRALGVGEATVKTHLHNLFEKTGTSGQADLVKLVAGHASPLLA